MVAEHDEHDRVVALRLYLAGHAPHSMRAVANLREALKGVPQELYTLEMVDALTAAAEAVGDGVVVAPTLVRITEPRMLLTGHLDDPQCVLQLLSACGEGDVLHHGAHSSLADRRIATRVRRIHAAVEKLRVLVGDQVDTALDPVVRAPLVLPQAQLEICNDARNFQRIFEQAPIGIALLSHDFHLVRANASMCAITGYSAEELAGMGLAEMFACGQDGQDCFPETREKMRACERGFCVVETPFLRRDGQTVWFRLSVTMMKEAGQGAGYLLALLQDVTEVKQADAELVAHRGRLEDLVRQRTEELAAANRKLMREMEEHMEADEAVRTLNEELETRVKERTAELEESNQQMEKMNSFFVGREVRMAELKAEIARLERENRQLKEQRRQ